ncbi:filamentous hemagglutinin N-terminal domain-containing protein [Methyloversatilis thermotolerans]|uniref:filamentous hemagglutinin N-terminal domain-containing protein n=1 Tax=Methyloversatilis thermotolerans TaxID=1346290 RepID=UPI00039D30B1|nr:filamentous hemagglutinin N-terminal domain-containing protein [Methyloversatilis thermotolerans]
MSAGPHTRSRPASISRATRRVLAWVLAVAQIPASAAGPALVPDASAGAGQRAELLRQNDVDVVQIARPSAAGVSHNGWTRFNVEARGVVFNNAATAARSALAGDLAANARLQGQAARIIINEITGNDPSSLLGPMEVAGTPARLVIANPNGITCDGCGFIGTSHVQLTTGRPDWLDGQLHFRVEGGRIEVGRSGLSALAERLDMIAGQVRTQGRIELAGALRVNAGYGLVHADSLIGDHSIGARDEYVYQIDIGQTVRADSIRMVAHGPHLGVRTAAPLQAVSDILLASRQGVLVEAPVQAGQDLSLYALGTVGVRLAAEASAARDLGMLTSLADVGEQAALRSGRDMTLAFLADNRDRWAAMHNAGQIDAAGRLRTGGVGLLDNAGSIRSGGSMDLTALIDDPPAAADAGPAATPMMGPGLPAYFGSTDNRGQIRSDDSLFIQLRDNSGRIYAAGDVFLWLDTRPDSRGAGEVRAGRDLFISAPSDAPATTDGPRTFAAGRDLRLFESFELFLDRPTLAAYLESSALPGQRGSQYAYANHDVLVAGRDMRVLMSGRFSNHSVMESGRDIGIEAAAVSNETPVSSARFTVDYPYYPGCRTEYDGRCSVVMESAGLPATLAAGRDLQIQANRIVNRGARMLAGGDIALQSPDTVNEDRRYGATWQAEYWLIDRDAQTDGGEGCGGTPGEPCATPIDWRRTASGEVELGVLPGIIQAAGRFDSDGGGVPPSGGNDSAGTGAASDGPADPIAALQRQLNDGFAGSRFVNTGTLHAGEIVVRAQDIRNGFDVVADYYHRTAALALPPADIDVAAHGTYGGTGVASGQYDPLTLMRLLPDELASSAPFALTPAQELVAIRNALLDTTQRAWILPGLGWDPLTGQSPDARQREQLAANGFAFALQHGVAVGQSLSADQRAAIDVPLLWYVEQQGALRPWLYLPASWREQLAIIPGGLLAADDAIALVADVVDNTGFVISEGALSVSARELLNRKRSAYYHEEFKVDGGTLVIEGSQVQPGGFMQAAHWAIDVDRIESLSGEFRVSGQTMEQGARLSAAFEQALVDELGDRFIREVARDDLKVRFKKDFGFGDVMGLATSFLVASFIGADVSSFIGGLASPGSTFAAASTTGAAGLGNSVASAFITQGIASGAGQLVATGSLDFSAVLNRGLGGGLSAGAAQWTGSVFNDPWAIGSARALTAGLIGEVTGSSFETALFDSVLSQASAHGAGRIGDGVFGEAGSVGHLLAHGALGALAEAARGGDPMSGAIGAMTAVMVETPLDRALSLSGTQRGDALLTALSLITGATAAGAAGGDPLAGGLAAQNVTLYNFLKHPEQERYAKAKTACSGDVACERSVDADFEALSQANKQDLADARATCDATGYCTTYYSLMNEAMPWGMGAQYADHRDPENPWLSDQQNAAAIAHNLQLYDQLMARTLRQEVVRQIHAPDPESYLFSSAGSSQYVSAITAQNTDKIVVLGAAGASLLLPGPEDLVVGAVLTTKAGQFVAQVVEVGGQKLLRFGDGRVADAAEPQTLLLPGPRKIEARWGASTYRHGGLMTGIEHIMYRHGPDSGFSNVSRFADGTRMMDISRYVDSALRSGTVIDEGKGAYTVEYDLNRIIGTNIAGKPASRIRVHIRHGVIQTAFPF